MFSLKPTCLVIFLLCEVYTADILLLSTVASISHSRWYGKLALLLAKHGHQVTVLDTDKNFFEHPNITHRIMGGSYDWLKDLEEDVKKNPDALDDVVEANSMYENFMFLADPISMGCDKLMKSEKTNNFIKEFKNKKFDLIIADGFCECFYALVSVFGDPPLIPACPYVEVLAVNFVARYDNPSYVPVHMTGLQPRMSFFERLINTVYHVMAAYITQNYHLPLNDAVAKEVLGSSAPTLEHILSHNVPLVMTGNHFAIQGAKPLPPNLIPIGGFHVDPPEPLPQDMKKFLDGAKDGAILFSMGSNFKSILMSEEKREMFLSVFKNIPQRVIWKLELNDSSNIPPNVMIKKWLPQSDILAHPKVIAFISHGGLLGTQEAVIRGVPVLGLPLMADQINNLMTLESLGVGIRLFYKKLNREYISQVIHKIVNDPSYLRNMKELSSAARDTPQTPQERALFWIEYVLRNGKNDNYLRSSSEDLAWYQRLLLDIIGFVLLCLVSVCFLVKYIVTFIFNLLCNRRKNESDKLGHKKKKS